MLHNETKEKKHLGLLNIILEIVFLKIVQQMKNLSIYANGLNHEWKIWLGWLFADYISNPCPIFTKLYLLYLIQKYIYAEYILKHRQTAP